MKEKEREEAGDSASAAKGGAAKAAADTAKKDVVIDWEGLTDRKARLTVHTSPTNDWLLSKDGEKLFYLTVFDKGNDLWVTEPRTRDTKLFAKLGADNARMEMSPDGKFIFVLADGKPVKIGTDDGKVTPIKTGGEMVLKAADERAYIFDHAWRQFKEKFYLPEITNVDWPYYYREYERFLPYIDNNYDFAELLSEMLGEVNASHTGGRFNAAQPNTDETAELGLLYDFTWAGDGVRVAEVVAGGPVDKAESRITAGDIIERIDGRPLTADFDFYALLNRKAGELTLLSMLDPRTNARWDESVKPIAAREESELLYRRWVRRRRAGGWTGSS